MKHQALPNNHFCIKISKVPNSPTTKTGSAPIQHFLTANHALEIFITVRFQCVRFEKKHCFALVVLSWFPICFYSGLYIQCNLYHTILLCFETKEMIYGSVNLKGVVYMPKKTLSAFSLSLHVQVSQTFLLLYINEFSEDFYQRFD